MAVDTGQVRADRIDHHKPAIRRLDDRLLKGWQVQGQVKRPYSGPLAFVAFVKVWVLCGLHRHNAAHVRAGRILGRQFVGTTVAGPDKAQTVPVQPVAGSSILGVRASPVANGDAVLVVANAVFVLPIEFIDLDFVAIADGEYIEGFQVPFEHLFHAVDHPLIARAALRLAGMRLLPDRDPGPSPMDVASRLPGVPKFLIFGEWETAPEKKISLFIEEVSEPKQVLRVPGAWHADLMGREHLVREWFEDTL